jgi:hypothetical protein
MTLEQQEKYSSFAIRFERDDEAGVWIAVSEKIGLVMEDDSLRGLLIRIATALPDFMG